MTKLETLVAILTRHPVYAESGKKVTTFVNKGNDANDFILISKDTLQRVMSEAYDAGKKAN